MKVRVTVYNDDEAGNRNIQVLHLNDFGRVPVGERVIRPTDSGGEREGFDMAADDLLIIRRERSD